MIEPGQKRRRTGWVTFLSTTFGVIVGVLVTEALIKACT